MTRIMPTRERLMLMAKYSDSLVDFRTNVEPLAINDDLGRRVYLLAIMLSDVEESEYVSPDPDIEHMVWVFHQSARLMINTIMNNADDGVMEALGLFKQLREELLRK